MDFVSGYKGLQNLKPILKNTYILICSYLSYEVNQGNCRSNGTKNDHKFKLEDMTTLSSILFNELHRILSLTSHEAPLDQEVGITLLEIDIRDSLKEILLLWRCCCLVVWLYPHDHTVLQSFRDAVVLLRRFYLKLISSQSVKSTDSSLCLAKQMLEVYVDEVFAERPFHESLAISQSVSAIWLNQSMSVMQIQSILEAISVHFLLSVSGDNALQSFLESLIWTEKRVESHPELCLTVGLVLIKHPVVMTAPLIVYSHLISLISEVLENHVQKTCAPISRSQFYLSAFYDAVLLYSRHFSKLMTSSCHQLDTPGKIVHRAFKPLFQFEIIDEVNLVVVDMDRSWRAQIGETSFNEIIDTTSYLKMNLHIISKASRDCVFTFTSSMISKVVSAEVDELLLERFREMTLQDMCLLASILKLMSCSLLQASRDSKNGLSCLELLSESKHMVLGNNSLSGVMSCFAQYNILPLKVQKLIVEDLKPVLSTNDESKLMLVHFAGLLSLCIISGLDILVKSCLIFMLALMNFLIQKEGGRPLGCESHVQAISQATSTNYNTVADTLYKTFRRTQTKISCKRAAAKFRRTRRLLLRRQRSLEYSGVADEETCNGEAYLRYFIDNSNDIAELADFIECNQEKDYTSWLNNRGIYMSKRFKKLAKQRQMRMTKVCRSLGYKGHVNW